MNLPIYDFHIWYIVKNLRLWSDLPISRSLQLSYNNYTITQAHIWFPPTLDLPPGVNSLPPGAGQVSPGYLYIAPGDVYWPRGGAGRGEAGGRGGAEEHLHNCGWRWQDYLELMISARHVRTYQIYDHLWEYNEKLIV